MPHTRIFKPRIYREVHVPTKLTSGELEFTGIMMPHRYGIIEGAYSSKEHFKGHQCTLARFERVEGKPRPIEAFDWKSRERVRADAVAEGRMREMDLRQARARMDEQARKFEERRIALW